MFCRTCCLVCFSAAAACAFAFTFRIFFHLLLTPSHLALLLLLLSFYFWSRFIFFAFVSFVYTLACHLQRHDDVVCLRHLHSFFQSSSLSVQHLCFYYTCTLERHHQCVWDSVCPNLFPSSFRLLVHCVCICCILTTRSHPFHSSSSSHNSTAHNRCDEFFWQPFFHCCFDIGFNVLIFVVLERSICTCSDHYLSVDRYVFCQSVHFDLHEWYIVSGMNIAFEISKSFSDEIFLLHPWLVISLLSVLSTLSSICSLIWHTCLFRRYLWTARTHAWSAWLDIWSEFDPLTFLSWLWFLSVCLVLLVLSCRRGILSLRLFSGSRFLCLVVFHVVRFHLASSVV